MFPLLEIDGRHTTGVFVDMAMTLIPSPPFTDDEMEQYALRAFSDALSVGLTSVHDASSMDSRMLDVFKRSLSPSFPNRHNSYPFLTDSQMKGVFL